MNASELLKAVGPDQTLKIVNWTQQEAREAFSTALYQIGAQRKLRPQYFQNKSRADQAKWLAGYLTWKNFDGVTEQLLQLWLLKAKVPMLTAFLDAAEIKHDGKGQVDDLPDELDAAKVKAGVDAMLKDNTPAEVAIYLNLFQKQKPGGWPAITKELEKRDELKLAAA
jgi:hypothetical protein